MQFRLHIFFSQILAVNLQEQLLPAIVAVPSPPITMAIVSSSTTKLLLFLPHLQSQVWSKISPVILVIHGAGLTTFITGYIKPSYLFFLIILVTFLSCLRLQTDISYVTCAVFLWYSTTIGAVYCQVDQLASQGSFSK